MTKKKNQNAQNGRKLINLSDKKTLKKIEKLAGLGLSDQAIADSLGVSRSTISRRKRDDDTFDAIIRKGKIKAVADISSALYESAMSGNSQSIQFFLKNRANTDDLGNWRDRTETTNISVNLADIISNRRSALSHSQGTLPPAPAKGIIINNED